MDGALRFRGRLLLVSLFLLSTFVFVAITLAADPPTPEIAGEPRVGETLTASGASLYKWQRCDPDAHPCVADANQNASGWQSITGQANDPSTYTLILADEGMLIRVLGKDTNLGTKFVPSGAVGPVEPPPPPPPPPLVEEPPPLVEEPPPLVEEPPPLVEEPPPLVGGPVEEEPSPQGENPPPPENETFRPSFRRTGTVEPLEGTVLVKLPGSNRWVELDDVSEVPMGTRVDVSNGSVLLTTQRKPDGRLQSIELWAGAFMLQQRRKTNVTVLTLAHSFAGAGQSGAQAAGHRKRRLWGRGRCRCRHRGRNSSGTARGTWWVTVELPRGTLTRVKKGQVLVRDFKRGKKVLVKRGQKYLARR